MGPHKAILSGSDPTDRLAIQETFYRFGIAHDENRVDVLATCFADDAVLTVVEGSVDPVAQMHGRAAILRRLSAVIRARPEQRRHCITNVVIDQLTESEASALAYGIVTCAAKALSVSATVIYSAELRKEQGGVWRFTRFLIGMDAGAKREPTAPSSTSREPNPATDLLGN